ncbi:MAG: hypothetical protein RIR70_658 [Pseudomonadota bacterium]|jgi:hypothetical protein
MKRIAAFVLIAVALLLVFWAYRSPDMAMDFQAALRFCGF